MVVWVESLFNVFGIYATGLVEDCGICSVFSTGYTAVLQKIIDVSTDPGPRLNIKTVLSTYGDFHVKDKTAVRTSYL